MSALVIVTEWSSEAPVAVSSLQAVTQPWVTSPCTHCLLGYISLLPGQRRKANHVSTITVSYRVTAQGWHSCQTPPGGMALRGTSWGKGGEEDVHLDQEGSDGALTPQLHLHIQGKVPRLQNGPLQGYHASVGVESACDEVALLITLDDGQGDGVPSKGGGRANAEDVSRYQ